jgi:hypothetical protein
MDPLIVEWLKANRPGYLETVEEARQIVQAKLAVYEAAKAKLDELRLEIIPQLDELEMKRRMIENERLKLRKPAESIVMFRRYDEVKRLAEAMVEDEHEFRVFTGGYERALPSCGSVEEMIRRIDPELAEAMKVLDNSKLSPEEEMLSNQMRQIREAHQVKYPNEYRLFHQASGELGGARGALDFRERRLMRSVNLAEAFINPQQYLAKRKEEEEQHFVRSQNQDDTVWREEY